MRAGMNPSLEKRLRRADPTVGLMVDAVAVDRQDVKKTVDDWLGADSLTGLIGTSPPEDVGVELSANLAVNLTNAVEDGNMTDLDGPPGFDAASPFFTAQVVWGGSEPDRVVLQRVKAWLDPDTGGGKNVDQWILQVFAIRAVGIRSVIDLVPIMDPVRVTAGASAGEVTFDLQGLNVHPKQLGAPENGGTDRPSPTTVLFIWAVQSDGTPATNVGWGRDSAQSSKTTTNNKLTGLRLIKGLGEGYLASGAAGGLPYVSFEWASYTTATITFSAGGAGNNIDLGAAPSNDLEGVLHGFTPGGTSFKAEINDGVAGWKEFVDGDLIGVDNTPSGGKDLSAVAKQQTYDIRCQLITNTTTDVTPKLTELGVAEVTITDFANLTTVSDGQWSVDPVTLKSEITQVAITAIRDGLNDYRDKITTLLSENDIGTIKFRVWWGASDLDRSKWFLVDIFNVRDYDPSGAAVVVTGVSALAQLKAVLPVVSASASEPYKQTNAGLKTVYDDLMDGQLGLDGQYRGPGVEDDTTTATNQVSDSDVKIELDAIARCGRGSIIASQGRVKFVQMFDDGAGAITVFPPEELIDVRVLPGFRERRPEFFVPWNYDFDEKRYRDRVQITHTTAISKLGITGLGDPPILDDPTARWIDTQALADQTGQDTVKALATGLMLWSFGSTQPHPELEPGDRIAVRTERFVAKDPLSARALRGRLWVIGRVQMCSVDARRFAVWIQGYTDIFTTKTAVTITKFAFPEVIEVLPTMNVSREVTVVVKTKAAVSVKVSVSTLAYPSLATTQGETAQDVDSDGVYTSGTLITVGPGEQLFITALAYELTGGGGSESTTMGKARIIHANVEIEATTEAVNDGFSSAQNAAAPENGDVVLTADNAEAFSNLEDANDIAVGYTATYDIDATGMTGPQLVTVSLYYNQAAGSTTWILADKRTHDNLDNLTNQTLTFNASLDTDYDLRIQITYVTAPGGNTATVTCHGEDHATPGVQYTKIVPVSTGNIDAVRVVSGTLLSARGGIGVSAPTTGNLLLGAGSSAMTELAPGAIGGYARSDGSAWARSGILSADLPAHTHVKADITDTPWAWTDVSKTGSSLADLATRSAADLSSGILPSARLSGVYSAVTGLGTQAQALDMGTQNIANVGTLTTSGDVTIGSLGIFDSSSAPSTDHILRYNGAKWISAFLHTQFLAGDGVSQINGDGTTSAFVYSSPTLSGAPTPNPSVAPVVTAFHKSILIDMSAYTLGATEAFVLDYSVDGGAYTSAAIITTGTNVVHATLTPGSTYAYKYLIRGASDTPYSPASSALNPLNDSSSHAFGIVLAANISTTSLSAISADIGTVTAGLLQNAAGTVFMDLDAMGNNPFIKHPKFELQADGDAFFKGQVDIENAQVLQTLTDAHIVLRDPDLAHGMTALVETNIHGAITFSTDTQGGLGLYGFSSAEATSPMKFHAVGGGVTHVADATFDFIAFKKSGTGQQAVADTDLMFAITNAAIPHKIKIFGNGDMTISGNVLIGTTTAATGSPRLDVLGTSQPTASVCVADGTVNATAKRGAFALRPYTNAEELLSVIYATIDASNADINIGGNSTAYNAATRIHFFTAANTTTLTGTLRLTIDSSGTVFINDSTNTFMTTGLTIRRDGTDEILAFKRDGVAHGMTTLAETDTYGTFAVLSNVQGGVKLRGYTEVTSAIELLGTGVTDNTASTTAALAYVQISATKKSGTSDVAIGSTANSAVIRNSGTTRFIFKADGTGRSDVAWNTYDEHDDIGLLAKIEDSFLGRMYEHRMQLEHLDLMTGFHVEDGRMRAMINWPNLNMLMIGGIRQNRLLVNRLQDSQDALRDRVAILEELILN